MARTVNFPVLAWGVARGNKVLSKIRFSREKKFDTRKNWSPPLSLVAANRLSPSSVRVLGTYLSCFGLFMGFILLYEPVVYSENISSHHFFICIIFGGLETALLCLNFERNKASSDSSRILISRTPFQSHSGGSFWIFGTRTETKEGLRAGMKMKWRFQFRSNSQIWQPFYEEANSQSGGWEGAIETLFPG